MTKGMRDDDDGGWIWLLDIAPSPCSINPSIIHMSIFDPIKYHFTTQHRFTLCQVWVHVIGGPCFPLFRNSRRQPRRVAEMLLVTSAFFDEADTHQPVVRSRRSSRQWARRTRKNNAKRSNACSKPAAMRRRSRRRRASLTAPFGGGSWSWNGQGG